MLDKIKKFFYREPDFVIGDPEAPYLRRWWIIPRNRFFNIYLHQFLRSDDDRALHDHPWASCSIILKGGYFEWLPNGVNEYGASRFFRKFRKPGHIVFRKAAQAHRVELQTNYIRGIDGGGWFALPAWTIFITGPKVREWGFHCPRGWRHWRDFCGVPEGEATESEVGNGCE